MGVGDERWTMRKWQRERNKKAVPKESICSFFKPKAAASSGKNKGIGLGTGSSISLAKEGKVQVSQHGDGNGTKASEDLLESELRRQQEAGTIAEHGTRDEQRNPFAISKTTSAGQAITLGKPTTSEGSDDGEANQIIPMSQGTGIVWRHSPAKKIGAVSGDLYGMDVAGGHGLNKARAEERKPLRDLIMCVAKPLESTKTVNTKNKNKAIEELMLGDTQDSLRSMVSQAAQGSSGGEGGGRGMGMPSNQAEKPIHQSNNPFARKRTGSQLSGTSSSSNKMPKRAPTGKGAPQDPSRNSSNTMSNWDH